MNSGERPPKDDSAGWGNVVVSKSKESGWGTALNVRRVESEEEIAAAVKYSKKYWADLPRPASEDIHPVINTVTMGRTPRTQKERIELRFLFRLVQIIVLYESSLYQ